MKRLLLPLILTICITTSTVAQVTTPFVQTQKLTAPNRMELDNFGQSAAIDGNTIIVGVPGDDIGEDQDQGSAYVFTLQGTIWVQQQKLTASDGAPFDSFGSSVAISGNTAIVSAPREETDEDQFKDDGAVYVFVRNGTSWSQQQKISISNEIRATSFGFSLAISGDHVIIGTQSDFNPEAYIYARSGSTWTRQEKITRPEAEGRDRFFSYRVAIEGDMAFISDLDANTVYFYERSGASWVRKQQLTIPSTTDADAFGGSVAVSGETLVVGAHADLVGNNNNGSAFIYQKVAGLWKLQQRISNGASNFGFSATISGDTIVVTALFSAFVYNRTGSTWVQSQNLGRIGELSFDGIELDGNTLVIADYKDLIERGAVYVFTRPSSACGDERDDLINEYQTGHVNLKPKCEDFTQKARSQHFSFPELNTGDYTWALVREPLTVPASRGYGLDKWRDEFGAPRTINSAYRNPARNSGVNVKGAGQSRHMYGDAVDLRNVSGTLSEWMNMKKAAQRAMSPRGGWLEPLTGPCHLNCFHADWRNTPGSYVGTPASFVTSTDGSRVPGKALSDDVTTLLNKLKDPNPDNRRIAFNDLLRLGFSEEMRELDYVVPAELLALLANAPAEADAIKLALINLLETETAHQQTLPPDATLDEEYVDYYGDVVAAVSALKDPRAVNSLLAVVDTGGLATGGLADLGPDALDPVIAQLTSPAATVRLGVAIVLTQMELTDAASLAKLKQALFVAAADSDPYVSRTAIEGLADLNLNALDDAHFFVRQHYLDFLNREPDADGLAFWTAQITSCSGDAQCIEVKRINVSAAFYLSIEFQETGYLVYRAYKAAFGNVPGKAVPITRQEMLPDMQQIGQGVQVGIGNWQEQLENNKRSYFAALVNSPRFTAQYPQSLTAEQFVDALNANANAPLSTAERNALVNDLKTNARTRAEVLRAVAEDRDLAAAEFNKAFVLMQYFGYLRRNPDETPDTNFDGFNFWLSKLNQFNGNFVEAEMVKAFINSIEYRRRFGQ